ncbi:NAD(P)H-binding protein [Streptomyces sp. V4-01]|uniref:NAD(P)H-binding protein n=1 Tax=Actinacidiphila polyblastidii TaxID=3110430 RepID=A0ABU7P902_9ACTN|nr:NAD(P)H-binding protein [Streptomyces sp. V4-01]
MTTALITGSRGRVARALTDLLRAAGHDVRAGSRSPEDLDPPPGVAVAALDLGRPEQFPAALDGVDAVFLYAHAARIAEFTAAAEAAGVRHVVLLSSSAVLAPGAGHDPLARHHAEVEAALAASALTSTVLRPGAFAGNALRWARSIRASGTVALPYPHAHSDPLHEADLAEAAFAALTDPAPRGGTHHLTGPQSLTFAEQLAVLGRATAREVRAVPVTPAAWRAEAAVHMPGEVADALLAFWRRHDGAPVPLTGTLERMTGRPPRTFAAWAGEHAERFAPAEPAATGSGSAAGAGISRDRRARGR